MRKKLFFVILVLCLVGSAYAINIIDPILISDITPIGIYSHSDNGEIWADSHLRMIDRSLTTFWGFSPARATDAAIEIVFDLGRRRGLTHFKWWNRATWGNYFALNIDVYKFTDDDPTKAPILVEMGLVTGLREPSSENVDIYADVINIPDNFYGRYIKLVFDDGPQNQGINIQGAEIAFIPEPATIVLLALGGLALIRKR